jgi:hypothetical protein
MILKGICSSQDGFSSKSPTTNFVYTLYLKPKIYIRLRCENELFNKIRSSRTVFGDVIGCILNLKIGEPSKAYLELLLKY